MSNHEFDAVKAEKENAKAKFRRVRNIAKLLQLLEVAVALTLISWSAKRLPFAVKLSREYLILFSAYVLNPHVVFVIGNAIVVSLYVLSRLFDGTGSDTASGAGIVSEEEYQKCSTIHHCVTANAVSGISNNELSRPQQPESVTEESRSEELDKQIVCFENGVEKTECAAASVAIKTATKKLQKFQRTQSEKLDRELSSKQKFRRSETEIRRLPVNSSPNHRRRALTSFDTVERLSNEEFRLTVEAFIEKQQSFLKSQKLAEISNKKKGVMFGGKKKSLLIENL